MLDYVAPELSDVSMKSGLEDRNNAEHDGADGADVLVSMKSGLEDRNNVDIFPHH